MALIEELGQRTEADSEATFVAINTITCEPAYAERFEELFRTRAHAIDRMMGFLGMHVLRSGQEGRPYLIVSYWKDEASFKAWSGSAEFLEGHQRGFEDIRKAKEAGLTPPMSSSFETYSIIAH